MTVEIRILGSDGGLTHAVWYILVREDLAILVTVHFIEHMGAGAVIED